MKESLSGRSSTDCSKCLNKLDNLDNTSYEQNKIKSILIIITTEIENYHTCGHSSRNKYTHWSFSSLGLMNFSLISSVKTIFIPSKAFGLDDMRAKYWMLIISWKILLDIVIVFAFWSSCAAISISSSSRSVDFVWKTIGVFFHTDINFFIKFFVIRSLRSHTVERKVIVTIRETIWASKDQIYADAIGKN